MYNLKLGNRPGESVLRDPLKRPDNSACWIFDDDLSLDSQPYQIVTDLLIIGYIYIYIYIYIYKTRKLGVRSWFSIENGLTVLLIFTHCLFLNGYWSETHCEWVKVSKRDWWYDWLATRHKFLIRQALFDIGCFYCLRDQYKLADNLPPTITVKIYKKQGLIYWVTKFSNYNNATIILRTATARWGWP